MRKSSSLRYLAHCGSAHFRSFESRRARTPNGHRGAPSRRKTMAKSEAVLTRKAADGVHPSTGLQAPPPALTDHHVLPPGAIERLGDDPDFVTALARGLA